MISSRKTSSLELESGAGKGKSPAGGGRAQCLGASTFSSFSKCFGNRFFVFSVNLIHKLSPYVAFGIMPIFAFANAGVSLEGLSFSSLLDKVPLGIVLGLFVGKQLGVFVFSYVSIKLEELARELNA